MIDTVWGIERNPLAPYFGKVVVPHIYLWNKRTTDFEELEAENLTGALLHGHSVDVIRSVEEGGIRWCYIKANVTKDNVTYPQRGWIRDTLLKNRGKNSDA